MRAIRFKSALAAGLLCLLAAGADAQHMGGGHGNMGGGHGRHMGDGRPGGAHPGGPHAGSRPGVGHVHGGAALPHRGGFNHGGHFVHGAHGGVTRIWWVSGGVWYPWYGYSYAYPYAYAAPDYTSVWYYCQSAGAYYPYVSYCPEGWVAVTPYAY